MRIANGVICVILLFFAALQWNDPDSLVWEAIYGASAIWPGIAAFKPGFLSTIKPLRLAGLAGIALCILGFALNASTITSDWIHVETAREAFGYLICAASIGLALYVTRPLSDTSLA